MDDKKRKALSESLARTLAEMAIQYISDEDIPKAEKRPSLDYHEIAITVAMMPVIDIVFKTLIATLEE